MTTDMKSRSAWLIPEGESPATILFMSSLNYHAELQKIIDNHQLAEVHLHGVPTYKVAYVLNVNEDFLTFAEVSSSATFAGVIICRMEDIDALKTDSLYLGELAKQLTDSSVYTQAIHTIEQLKKFTFDGWLAAFAGSTTVHEVVYGNEDSFAGRIISYNDDILLIDEFYADADRRFARTYINRDVITRLAIGVPWTRTIARSLIDKQL